MKWILNDDGSATCDNGKAWYVIRTKFVVEHDHGAQVWRVQSYSDIDWQPFLAQLYRVERL